MSTTPALTQGTVVAYFNNEAAAEKAVSQLRDAGFSSNQVGVASRSYNREADPTHAANTTHESAWEKFKNFFSADPVEPYADERAKGDLASREVTPADDYSTEDFHQSLSGLSIPEERSRYFGSRFNRGGQAAVVTVSAPGREADAERILIENGGDLGNTAAGYDYDEVDEAPLVGNQRIQLLGEVLRVHKDRVTRGEVRIRKEVITETQTVEVPVTREELVIERFAPVGADPVDARVGEGSEIRIPLTEEVASVDKHTLVREEVAVGKVAVQDVHRVGDAVSHEELIVEDTTNDSKLRSV